MKKILISLLSTLLFLPVIYAQRPGGGTGKPGGNMARPIATLQGYIFSDGEEIPLEFANVALFRVKDSTMITGGITDKTGYFLLETIPFGRYYLVADFIGFKKEVVDNITIKPPKKAYTVEPIYLEMVAQNLEGVEIVAEANRIEYKIDKKVVNVSKDYNATGGTAVDVLENTPSVEVDIDGNVSLRGSENFQVYIDGKPTVLEGSDLLQQLPASTISQIEIITNPSVKFDPDGSAGIINVLMKKQFRDGMNGVVNASGSTNGSYSGDFLINYRKKKINWFVGADYRERGFSGESTVDRITYGEDTTYYYNSDSDRSRNRDGYSLQGGFDYDINRRNTISLSGKVGHYEFGRLNDSKIISSTDPISQTEFLKNKNDFDRQGDYYRGTLNYTLDLDDNGQRLMVMAYYSDGDDDELEIQDDYLTDADFNIIDSEVVDQIRATEEESEQDMRFKADYTLPFSDESVLEAGFQSRIKREESSYIYTYFDNDLNEWVNDAMYSNDFNLKRDIHSAYTTYGGTIGIIGVQAGMRFEYTDRTIDNSFGEEYVVNRWDWFPSLHTSLELDKKHKLMASYSKRIRRPRGWYLDPVVSYEDRYTLRQGNPGLEPEYTNSFEVSFMKRFKTGFFTIESFYRRTNNVITRLSSVYEDDILLMTYANLNKDEALGIEVMMNTALNKWWTLNVSGTAYHYTVTDEDASEESENWNFRMNNDFKLALNSRLQVRGNYNAPSATIQGERGASYYMSLAFRQDFMKKRLNMTVSVRDVFGTRKREITLDQPDYYMKQEMNRDPHVVRFSLSYKINDYKNKKKSGDMEESDMDGEGDF